MCITAKTGRSLTLLRRSAVTTLPSFLLRVKSMIIFWFPLRNEGSEERGCPELLHLPQSPLQSTLQSWEPTESPPEPTPVREPTESAPQPAPVRKPTNSTPEPAPVQEPTESTPASESSSVPAPAYKFADPTVVTRESTKSSDASQAHGSFGRIIRVNLCSCVCQVCS